MSLFLSRRTTAGERRLATAEDVPFSLELFRHGRQGGDGHASRAMLGGGRGSEVREEAGRSSGRAERRRPSQSSNSNSDRPQSLHRTSSKSPGLARCYRTFALLTEEGSRRRRFVVAALRTSSHPDVGAASKSRTTPSHRTQRRSSFGDVKSQHRGHLCMLEG